MGELDDPAVVAFPLRGEWTVERTPADRIPSHGTDMFGQRFAYDLVRTDHRSGSRAGEAIGRVGHPGNSTAPHLHFQLTDSADPLQMRGIPCAFAEYLVQRDGRWDHVERGIPRRLERIRSP